MASGKPGAGRLGKLKLFIGAAPGVGKTYTMLREASTLRERGVDVVVGYVDVHDRSDTAAQTQGLEIIPRLQIKYKHHQFEEVDLTAILRRCPEIVVIDELAHANAPGAMHPKRYLDVEYLLDRGVGVLTAVNVQHIEGVHEEAEEITGMKVRETIPLSFLKRAAEMEVIDVTPETLRQRLLDGKLYPPDKIDQALNNYFRKSNLSALRELALREVAEDVEERLQRSFDRSKIPGPVGAKETVLVCVNYSPRAAKLILSGKRMADRMKADLLVLTILEEPEAELSSKLRDKLGRIRAISRENEAELVVEQKGDRKLGEVIIETAQRLNVTQILIGQSHRANKWAIWQERPAQYLLRNLKYIDLRIVGWKDHVSAIKEIVSVPGPLLEAAPEGKDTGKLTIYVGAAPGVGKTYKMLRDANDWRGKDGVDVVVGLIETHGRPETAAQIGGLEVLPRRLVEFEGHCYEELDVAGVLARRPRMVLIDELAHTNVPGSEREKRYQDVEFILSQGIDVITAVNIQHLESLHDKVEHITGVRVRERLPDWFMDLAGEVKLIDVSPEALQERLLEGKIYAPEKVERALDHFFRLGNLAALREMALLEVADDVDQRLDIARREENGANSDEPAEPVERVLVCVNYRPHSEKLIRRGWRIADRYKAAELYCLVVASGSEMTDEEKKDLERVRRLSEQFEADFLLRKTATDAGIGSVIAQVAEELRITQIVIGQPFQGKSWLGKLKPNPVDHVLEHTEFVDLFVVSSSRAAKPG